MARIIEITRTTEDGSQLKICVRIFIDDTNLQYCTDVELKEKGKKAWKKMSNFEDNWSYRALSMDDRRKFVETKNREYLGSDLYKEVLQKAWESVKPQELN